MAPDLVLSTGCLLLDKYRHSPRIFNKLSTKLDISKVKNKLDFMKSLNLCYISNSEEAYSKVNEWEVVLPRNSLPLKQCSVVISVVKCNVCKQPLNNQTDVEHHKNLHNRLTDNGYASADDNVKESSERENMQESCFECKNKNNLEEMGKTKSNKKHGNRRRRSSKEAVTKLTLKIGAEVISKVYCKKKYLSEVCLKEDKITAAHNQENYKSNNEVKNMLCTNKISNVHAKLEKKRLGTDQSDCHIARLKKMAAALVELELRQKAYCITEGSDFFSGEEFNEVNQDEDDAVVPEVSRDFVDSNDIDDDIQEILGKSRSAHDLNNEANTYFGQDVLTPIKDCEVITIDDEGYDLEDDCVIIEERLDSQGLRNLENSYVFHVESNLQKFSCKK